MLCIHIKIESGALGKEAVVYILRKQGQNYLSFYCVFWKQVEKRKQKELERREKNRFPCDMFMTY